jgi:NHL repeat-containing protein
MAMSLLVLGIAVLLASCGDDGESGAPGSTGATVTTAQPAVTLTLAAAAVEVEFVRAVPLDLDGRFHAVGVGVDRGGSVYVANTVRHRVEIFDARGRAVGSWGGKGTAAGRLRFYQDPEVTIGGLAVTPDGTVYVADSGNGRVQVFDAKGRYRRGWGRPGSGQGGSPGSCRWPWTTGGGGCMCWRTATPGSRSSTWRAGSSTRSGRASSSTRVASRSARPATSSSPTTPSSGLGTGSATSSTATAAAASGSRPGVGRVRSQVS